MKNPPNKPQKSNGDLVSGLLKHIDYVLDDVRNLEAHQSHNPYVDKYIRTELAIAYHETKKCVEKILAERPEIKDAPTNSTDPNEYLRNARTWCVGQLYWEDGERIGVEKATISKGRRIWTWVKIIPRWIYVLVIFLAALLTCLYCLGWLEPIKAFIVKILWPK